MCWRQLFLAGLLFFSAAAHADFKVAKDKGFHWLRMHDGWGVGAYDPLGYIAFNATVKDGKVGEISLMLTKREVYAKAKPWPWRQCLDFTLHIDDEVLPLREGWYPSWELGHAMVVILSMDIDIVTIEKMLVSKEAMIKVCEDEIKLTPSMRLDLMKFRDAYRKY